MGACASGECGKCELCIGRAFVDQKKSEREVEQRLLSMLRADHATMLARIESLLEENERLREVLRTTVETVVTYVAQLARLTQPDDWVSHRASTECVDRDRVIDIALELRSEIEKLARAALKGGV